VTLRGLTFARWEPAANLGQCTRLLQSFWNAINAIDKDDEKDYHVGEEVRPPREWIGEYPPYSKFPLAYIRVVREREETVCQRTREDQ